MLCARAHLLEGRAEVRSGRASSAAPCAGFDAEPMFRRSGGIQCVRAVLPEQSELVGVARSHIADSSR